MQWGGLLPGVRENCCISTVGELASTSYWQFLEGTAPVGHYSATTWITDNEWAFVGHLGCVHEAAQLVLIHWRRNREVRNGTQGSEVEGSVMGGPVLSHESGTVETEDNVQAAKRYIVNDIVECTLSEG